MRLEMNDDVCGMYYETCWLSAVKVAHFRLILSVLTMV